MEAMKKISTPITGLQTLMAAVAAIGTALPFAAAAQSVQPAPVAEIRPGILAGYLSKAAWPDSLALLPPPPAAGSAALLRDEQANLAARALHGTSQWAQAREDDNLMFPQAAGTFSCALDAPVDSARTPFLNQLLRRSLADAGLSTYAAKNYYARPRPMTVNQAPVCAPDPQTLRNDGSYPSGHSAVGWAWALILAELAPERANAIFARGMEYGQSRAICNVHWQSDIDAGRIMGAAAVARLHADAAFRSDLERARIELAEVRAAKLPPQRECKVEAAQ